jgi:hypothetical protein
MLDNCGETRPPDNTSGRPAGLKAVISLAERRRRSMQDLSVLTPPLLMCAVVLIAIGAFLRHEMSRRREDPRDPDDESPADISSVPIPGRPEDSGQEDSDPSA